jgi:hypothetical protein
MVAFERREVLWDSKRIECKFVRMRTRILTSSLILAAMATSRSQEVEVPQIQNVVKAPTSLTASSSDDEVRLYAGRFAARQRGRLVLELDAYMGFAKRKLDLDEVRLWGLKNLGTIAVDSAVERITDRVVAVIDKLGRHQPPAILTRAATATAAERVSTRSQRIWLDGIHEWLSPEQSHQIETEFDRREERRLMAMQQALFLSLDDELRFSPGQWEKVAPKLADVIQSLAQSRDKRQSNFAGAIQTAVQGIKEEVVRPDLDPVQMLILTKRQKGMGQEGMKPSPQTLHWIKSQPPPENLAETETLLSAFLEGCYLSGFRWYQVEVDREVAQMEWVLKLSAIQQEEFRVIGKGVIQDALESVRPRLAQWIHSATSNAGRTKFTQQLASLTAPQYPTKVVVAGSAPWKQGMATILTAEQRELWRADEDRRRVLHRMARREMMMDEVDRQVQLGSDQIEPMKSLIDEILERYEPDLEKGFRNRLWHLQLAGLRVPWVGVSVSSLQSLLSEEQCSALQKMITGNLDSQWQSIQKLHDARMASSSPQS